MSFANLINIPFKIAAGETLALPGGSWDFLYVAELTANANVIADAENFRVPLVSGRRININEKIVQAVNIENRGSGEISGLLVAGSGDITDSQVVGTISVTVNDSVNGLAENTITGAAQSIAANSSRKKLYLYAPDTNGGVIWIGSTETGSGIALQPGGSFDAAITGAVDFIGTLAGDKLQALEVV